MSSSATAAAVSLPTGTVKVTKEEEIGSVRVKNEKVVEEEERGGEGGSKRKAEGGGGRTGQSPKRPSRA